MKMNFPLLKLCLLLLSAQGQREHPNVDYQIHSNNDLRELPQTLMKGARGYKFDPHYVQYNSVCQDSDDCLVLSHDVPVPSHSEYNTSTDLFNFINSEEFATLSNKELVTIALCFKSAPDKCNSTSVVFNRWLELVDEFYNAVVAANIPNVKIVLDGDGKPENCLIGRWKLWNSVWISSPSEAFYSDDEENDYYRFQTLNDNENVANWEWMASEEVNYGKFSAIHTPYQLWEPDAQEDIIEYINIYRSGKAHAGGFHFAINTDIAMFRVYSASDSSNTGQDVAVGVNKPVDSAATAQRPHLIQLSAGVYVAVYQKGQDVVFCAVDVSVTSFSADVSSSVVTLDPSYSSWLLQNNEQPDDLIQVVSLYSDDGGSMESSAMRTQVLLAARSGKLLVVELILHSSKGDNQDDLSPKMTLGGSFAQGQLSLTSADVLDVAAVPSKDIETGSGGTACKLFVLVDQAPVLKLGLHTLKGLSVELTWKSDGTSGDLAVNVVAEMDLELPHQSPATAIDSARAVFAKPGNGTSDRLENMFVFASVLNNVLGIAAQLSAKSQVYFVTNWVTISVGSNLAVSYSPLFDTLLVMNEGGYCFNSHTHNTRSVPSVCTSPPLSTPYVLDYTFGLTQDWVTALRDSNCAVRKSSSAVLAAALQTNTNRSLPAAARDATDIAAQLHARSSSDTCHLVSPCHTRLLHGTYDQGSHPTVALSRFASGADGQTAPADAFFLELHEGYSLPDSHIGGCGEPIHRDGIVLDSFDISDWVQTLLR